MRRNINKDDMQNFCNNEIKINYMCEIMLNKVKISVVANKNPNVIENK